MAMNTPDPVLIQMIFLLLESLLLTPKCSFFYYYCLCQNYCQPVCLLWNCTLIARVAQLSRAASGEMSMNLCRCRSIKGILSWRWHRRGGRAVQWGERWHRPRCFLLIYACTLWYWWFPFCSLCQCISFLVKWFTDSGVYGSLKAVSFCQGYCSTCLLSFHIHSPVCLSKKCL